MPSISAASKSPILQRIDDAVHRALLDGHVDADGFELLLQHQREPLVDGIGRHETREMDGRLPFARPLGERGGRGFDVELELGQVGAEAVVLRPDRSRRRDPVAVERVAHERVSIDGQVQAPAGRPGDSKHRRPGC